MAENTPLVLKVGEEKVYWTERALKAEAMVANLTRQRDEATARAERAEQDLAAMQRPAESAESDWQECEHALAIIHAADQRAIAQWRAVHPGNDLVMPDSVKLSVWLMEQLDQARAENERLRGIVDDPALLESLAENAHVSWSGWAKWMLAKWNDTHSSGERFTDRWARQVATTYDLLSEAEKESDREEARPIITIIRQAIDAAGRAEMPASLASEGTEPP